VVQHEPIGDAKSADWSRYQLRDSGVLRCGHLPHERLSLNDDVASSLAVASGSIERLSNFFQIRRLSTQEV